MLNHKVIQSGDGDSKGEIPVKEYYEVFGLQEGASLEDVAARYMVLKKQIISSIEQGKKPNKTIQEINEAYVKLRESKIPAAVNFDLEEHLRKSITSLRAERRKARKRKIILASSVLAVFLIVGVSVLMLQRPKEALPPGSISPEDPNVKAKASLEKAGTFSALEPKAPEKVGEVSEVVPKEPSKPALLEKAKPDAPKPSLEEPPAASKPPAKPAPSVEVALAVPQEPSKPAINERAKPVAEGVAAVETAKQVPPAPAPETPLKEPQEMKAKVETPVVPVVPPPPKAAVEAPVLVAPPPKPAPPVEVAKAAPQEASQIAKPESAKAPEPVREKEQKVASVPPSPIASDLEVRNFFDNYLLRYNRKEINSFMALFSAKAIQNKKDDVEKIRRVYGNFFDQMESVNYQIAITGIEPKQDRLEVKAQYVLEGIVSKGRRGQTWKGQVQWVLVREEGALRVLSLDYQPSSK
jgi:hypothetical protein